MLESGRLKLKSFGFFVVLIVFAVFFASCGTADKSTGDDLKIQGKHPDFTSGEDMNYENSGDEVDLRNLNGNIIYAVVYNMMTSPDEYLGKTIRVRGQYYGEQSPEDQIYYHFVFISDAQACCQQGLEILLKGGSRMPQDYPEIDSEVEISGIWEKYKDGENVFYRIGSSTVEVIGG